MIQENKKMELKKMIKIYTNRIKRTYRVGDQFCDWGIAGRNGWYCDWIKKINKNSIILNCGQVIKI